MKRIHSIILFFVAVLFPLPVFGQSQEKELWIQNGERSIYGVLSKPESAGKRQPVAIISHGFTPDEQAQSLAQIKAFLEGLR